MNFNIPEGYSCVVRANDTTLYGYSGSVRDTFTYNGFSWQKTATSTSSYPNNPVCVVGAQLPSNVSPVIMFGGYLFALAFFVMIYKMFKRVLF